MRYVFLSIVFAVSLVCGGCSVHPVQQDATNVPTLAIVEAIRCETRSAIIDTALNQLRRNGHGDQAAELEANRDIFFDFPRSALTTPRERAFYDRYIKTGIALEFTFDISEDDAASANVDFVHLLTRGTVSVPLAASNDRMRQNTRKFVVSDTFDALLRDQRLRYCPTPANPPNLVYPSTGSIGVVELIDTFISLNEYVPLAAKEDKVPVFGDTLIFTTTFTGSVAPSLTLSPVGRNLQVASAGFSTSAMRKDIHQLLVGLSLPPKTKLERPDRTASGPFQVGRKSTTVFAKTGIKSDAEYRAVEVITQQRIDTFFDRFGRTLAQ